VTLKYSNPVTRQVVVWRYSSTHSFGHSTRMARMLSTPHPDGSKLRKDPVTVVQEDGWDPGTVWKNTEYLAFKEIRFRAFWTVTSRNTDWATPGINNNSRPYKNKGWINLVTCRRYPEVSRKLSFPYYVTTAQDGDKVVSLRHRPLFTHTKYSWYSFLFEDE